MSLSVNSGIWETVEHASEVASLDEEAFIISQGLIPEPSSPGLLARPTPRENVCSRMPTSSRKMLSVMGPHMGH